jgi:hypothetical protein
VDPAHDSHLSLNEGLRWRPGVFAAVVASLLVVPDYRGRTPPDGEDRRAARVRENGVHLPLCFERNEGQVTGDAQFLGRSGGWQLAFDSRGLLSFKGGASFRLTWGTSQRVAPEGVGVLPGKVNYFVGNDPSRWRAKVPTYWGVKYAEVYPGVDLVFHGDGTSLEYDLMIHPGARPGSVRLRFDGVDDLGVDGEGNLRATVSESQVTQRLPVVYQETDAGRTPVRAEYVLASDFEVAFRVSTYDAALPLVIDPTVVYSTYLGGSVEDIGMSIAVDVAGNTYITGYTDSPNFPTASPYQAVYAGSVDNVFISKFNSSGSDLIYSTYLGGSDDDEGFSIAVDTAGNAYVTGYAASSDFPTLDPYQPAFGGLYDAFVAKLNAEGSLVYSTYLGGQGDDEGNGIAVDNAGSAYVTGFTSSTNFPTANPYQASLTGSANVFVTKINAAGSALVYSTYLGGNGNDVGAGVAVDAADNAYVTGLTTSTNFPTKNPYQASFGGGPRDAFVATLNASGTALVYSTYLGGSSDDYGTGIAVDAEGSAYATGYTGSTNFPTANAYQAVFGGGTEDAFVTKLSATGSALAYSTYLGGSAEDDGYGIAVDASREACIVGHTRSTNFPTANPVEATNTSCNGCGDAFVTKLSASGSALVYSTYLGGRATSYGYGITVDDGGTTYATGYTQATDFPTFRAFQAAIAGGSNVFVTSLSSDLDSGTFDAGPDGGRPGVDGGTSDGGSDASSLDAGLEDAGSTDAGSDAAGVSKAGCGCIGADASRSNSWLWVALFLTAAASILRTPSGRGGRSRRVLRRGDLR